MGGGKVAALGGEREGSTVEEEVYRQKRLYPIFVWFVIKFPVPTLKTFQEI